MWIFLFFFLNLHSFRSSFPVPWLDCYPSMITLKFISSVLSSEPQTPISKWPPSIFTVFEQKIPSAISKKKKKLLSSLIIFLSLYYHHLLSWSSPNLSNFCISGPLYLRTPKTPFFAHVGHKYPFSHIRNQNGEKFKIHTNSFTNNSNKLLHDCNIFLWKTAIFANIS